MVKPAIMAIWALLMGSAAGLAHGGPLGALAGAAIGAAVDRVLAVRAARPRYRGWPVCSSKTAR